MAVHLLGELGGGLQGLDRRVQGSVNAGLGFSFFSSGGLILRVQAAFVPSQDFKRNSPLSLGQAAIDELSLSEEVQALQPSFYEGNSYFNRGSQQAVHESLLVSILPTLTVAPFAFFDATNIAVLKRLEVGAGAAWNVYSRHHKYERIKLDGPSERAIADASGSGVECSPGQIRCTGGSSSLDGLSNDPVSVSYDRNQQSYTDKWAMDLHFVARADILEWAFDLLFGADHSAWIPRGLAAQYDFVFWSTADQKFAVREHQVQGLLNWGSEIWGDEEDPAEPKRNRVDPTDLETEVEAPPALLGPGKSAAPKAPEKAQEEPVKGASKPAPSEAALNPAGDEETKAGDSEWGDEDAAVPAPKVPDPGTLGGIPKE